jgi:PAS domain S-box-containing protein
MEPLLHSLTACGEAFKEMSFTVVDMTLDDEPLVYINDHFLAMTGYRREDVISQNCRFLQGKTQQVQARHQVRKSLERGQACYQDFLNHRKDGTPFWNRLCLFPITHDVIGVKYYVGIQLDVTEQKQRGQTKSIVDFVKNPDEAQLLYQEIANPLEEVLTKTRALKYFGSNDLENAKQRRETVDQIQKSVTALTKMVAAF